MQRLSRTVFRNSAFGLASQIAIKVLSFAFSVMIVRNLGAEAFGQYAAIGAFGSIFIFISDLGLSPYVIRQVARNRDTPGSIESANRLYGNVVVLRILLSLLAGLCMVVFAWLTQRPPLMILAIVINGLGLAIYGVQGTSEAMLSGYERLDVAATGKVMQQLLFIVLGGVALWLGTSYFGLIFANLISAALLLLICWRGAQALGLRPKGVTSSIWPALIRASIPFGIIGFTLGLSYKFDSVLLNIFRGDVETGYYNAAYNLIFSMVVLSNIFNTSLFPSLARRSANTSGSLAPIHERALVYLMVVALPMAFGVWALSDQLVLFLFGANYAPVADALRILVWVVPLMYASEFLGYVVIINSQEKAVARSIAVSTTINVLLNLAFVPLFGYIGAAVMTVLTEAVLVSQYAWLMRADLRQLNFARILLGPLAASLAMTAVILIVHSPSMVISIALGIAVYAALVLVFGVLGKDEVSFVRSLWRKAETQPG